MGPLMNCALQRWQLGFRDPYLMGWVTVAVFCAAAIFAIIASKSAGFSPETRRFERLFWRLVALLMAMLALNKQLDFHTFFISLGRCLSHSQGWYDARRDVQMWIVIILIAGTGGLSFWIIWGLRSALRHMTLPFVGLAAVVCFVLLRIMLFFHVYHTHIFGNNDIVSRVFELVGPLFLMYSAYQINRSNALAARTK